MKNLNFYVLIVMIMAISASTKGQEGNSYLSQWDNLNLSGDSLPAIMPYNRIIDPAGEQIYFGDQKLENHALDCSLSPDGKTLAIESRFSIVFYGIETGEIISELRLKEFAEFAEAKNTYSGIKWYQKGGQQYVLWSLVSQNKSYVVKAKWDGESPTITNSFEFKRINSANSAIPNEIELLYEDLGDYLVVVLNGNNQVVKLNIDSGEIIWETNVGVAPFGIVSVGNKLFVTNWGGGTPEASDINVAGIPWGKVKTNPINGATREGSVSVIDSKNGKVINEIIVGLHPNDIIKSTDGHFVYVANANSDNVSVIETEKEQVVETISVRLLGDKNPYWGSSPNGLGISSDGKTLYVANGMENAVAAVKLGRCSSLKSKKKESDVSGFIPTGAYPSAICVVNDKELFVCNIEAEGARIADLSLISGEKPAYNTHRMLASVSRISVPRKRELAAYSEKVAITNQLFRIKLTQQEAREDVAPVPVPERIGEPSVFKHVIYIIKENRTYDQILGDMPEGNGEPELCVFGEEITPNTHSLAREFVLLDNYHASGKCSAEGHQWTDASIVTDYIEKNVRAWFRSYPHVQTDALTYSPTGFLWDNALRNEKSVRIYGEAAIPVFSDTLNWTKIYAAYKENKPFIFTNKTTVAPVEKLLSPSYPGYDHHMVPDVLRAKAFIAELNDYEAMEGDQWPALSMVALPNDHTAGTREGLPTPRSMVADNDLALGQIIEAISKSKFWKNTVIFVTEDDSQSGWDHVSAYRTLCQIISPYSKSKKTISTQYNQTSMVRTIEQILGLPPMNILDATALPMFDCFSSDPVFSEFKALPNNIPLDEMNPNIIGLKGKELHYAKKSMEAQFNHVDGGNEQLLNKIVWFASNKDKKYPKEFAGKEEDDDD